MTTVLEEKRGKLTELAIKQKSLYDAISTDTTLAASVVEEKHEAFKSLQQQLTGLRKEIEPLEAMEAAIKANQEMIAEMNRADRGGVPLPHEGKGGAARPTKSLGEWFTSTNAYKTWNGKTANDVSDHNPDWTKASTITESAGFAPANNRIADVVPYANRVPVIADLIPQTQTELSIINYMEATTWENNAAAVAQAAAKPQSDFKYTARSVQVEKIATWVEVTEEQVEDVPTFRDIINQDLTLALELSEDSYLLTGNGSTPQINGFYNKITQSQALGALSRPDAIYLAMTKVRTVGYANPSGVVLHPDDWSQIKLLTTTTGEYIWGSPALTGAETIWGLPTIVTTAATSGTGLVGDFRMYSRIYRRTGITVKVGLQNAQFVANLLTVLAEERMTLVVRRINAFCLVTGI